MDEFLDYFMLLQVHPMASKPVIKSAYKALCHLYHPDNGGDVEELLKIQEAYETLSQPHQRQTYLDQWTKHYRSMDERGMKDYYALIFQPVGMVVDRYMKAVVQKDYQRAYVYLSQTTKEKIALKDYVTWQDLVAQVHELLDYQYEFGAIEDRLGVSLVSYKVRVKELNLLLHRVEEDYFNRVLVEEEGRWKVLLPDLDLRQINKKYRRAIMTTKKQEKKIAKGRMVVEGSYVTRYVSMNTFEANLDYEFLRTQRYKTPCTLLRLTFDLTDKELVLKGKVTTIFEQNLRNLDSFSMTPKQDLVILLPQTTKEQGRIVLHKLREALLFVGIDPDQLQVKLLSLDPERYKNSYALLKELS